MADNYLENRMEAYRSGRLARINHTSSSMRKSHGRSDTLTLRYPPMVVIMVAYALSPIFEETVAAFCRVGCRVAFTFPDVREGNALAQRTGARYYPSMHYSVSEVIDDVIEHWGKPEIMLFDSLSAEFQSIVTDDVRVISLDGYVRADVDNDVMARHILYLAHPSNARLIGL